MSSDRLKEYLEQMRASAEKACGFVGDMSYDAFRADDRTQMAVGMAFVLVADAAARIMTHYPDFPVDHPDVPWSKIKGMCNVVVHDYYELELPVVFETVRTALPDLIFLLDSLHNWRAQGE